jgi:hypothetical protein
MKITDFFTGLALRPLSHPRAYLSDSSESNSFLVMSVTLHKNILLLD